MLALLEEGADPNHPLFWSEEWTYEYPPLHQACRNKKPDIVTALVKSGADVKRVDRLHKQSPLDHACFSRPGYVVQYLDITECEVGEYMNVYI